MRILALDPGVTTGYVIGTLKFGTLEGVQISIEQTGNLTFPGEVKKLLNQPFHVVVVEDFILSRQRINDKKMTASQVIGAVKVLVPSAKIVWQQPAEKIRVPDKLLKKWDLWEGRTAHEQDAIRHLIIWQQKKVTKQSRSPLRLLRPTT